MTKSTMTSQWDPGSYRPLDMSKIPGYPREMPPHYEESLPCFAGIKRECPEFHMMRFWNFFRRFPVDNEAEDLVMKLFSASLHGEARRWYDDLPAASIDSMEHFERVFLARWTLGMEDIQSLLEELEGIKQAESESISDYAARFRETLHQFPPSHHPEDKYLVYLYTKGFQPHLSFLLDKRKPKTIPQAHKMALEIEKSLFMTKTDAMDALSMMKLVSHKDFVEGTQEKGKQIVDQQNKNLIKEQEPEKNNEVSTCAPPTKEVMQEPVSPVQQNKDEVSTFPFQISNDVVLLDSKDEEEREALDEIEVPCCALEDKEAVHEDEVTTYDEDTRILEVPAQEETVSYPPLVNLDNPLPCDEKEEEDDDIQILEALAQEGLSEVHCSPFQSLNDYLLHDTKSERVLDVLTPPCYDTDTDIADFDEFIHVGRRRWDAIGYDTDPIYDTKDHLRMLPLQLPQQISFDQWQKRDEVFTCSIQNTKDDLLPLSSDVCQSYLEMFDEYAEHLNPFYENDYRPPLCSDLGTSKDIVCLKKVTHDFSSQPPVVSLPCFSIQGVVGKYLFRVEFPPRQTLDFKGWLGNNISNQFFNPLLMICQPSTKLLSILPLESEDVLGNQSTGPLCPFSEPCTFYDPFLDRIEFFPQRWTWQYFDPPTRLHELDADLSDDMMYILTHDIFVLDVSLFWFMMKHKGRYQGALLDWLHWLFDYTNLQPTGKYR
jgi:hypothetical protein